MKKAFKVFIIVFTVLISLILIAIAGFNVYQHINCKEFYDTDEKEFLIPGLSDNFVPQGLSYNPDSQRYIVAGYMADGSASRIYVVDPETSEFNYVELKTETKKADASYISGVAVYDSYVFVSSGDAINIYDLSDVEPTEKMKNDLVGTAIPVSTFDPLTTPEFVHIDGSNLYVGELYIPGERETEKEHQMTTDSGDKNQALMMVFDVDDVIANIETTDLIVPKAAVSTTGYIQGMCFLKSGQICVSQPYGFSASHIKIYDDPMKSHFNGDGIYVTESGNEVPLYYLDSAHLLKDYKVPPMTKELYADGERVLVMSESASSEYIIGKLTNAKYCYSFLPEF